MKDDILEIISIVNFLFDLLLYSISFYDNLVLSILTKKNVYSNQVYDFVFFKGFLLRTDQ